MAPPAGSRQPTDPAPQHLAGVASDRSDDRDAANRNRCWNPSIAAGGAFFVGQYLLPALEPRERGMLLPAFSVGAVLFLVGASFCYFLVLPRALRFFQDFNQWLGLETSWTMASYTDFVLQMLVGFGLSFELPLVMVILARLGILQKTVVAAHRRHAIVILLVVAACVTPTSDPFNLALMFVPLYGLFELGLAGMGWAERNHRTTAVA